MEQFERLVYQNIQEMRRKIDDENDLQEAVKWRKLQKVALFDLVEQDFYRLDEEIV